MVTGIRAASEEDWMGISVGYEWGEGLEWSSWKV